MDRDLLQALYDFCMDEVRLPQDEGARAARQRYQELEDQIQEAMGLEFVDRLDQVWYEAHRWYDLETFRQGLCLGVGIMLLAGDHSSNSPSEP